MERRIMAMATLLGSGLGAGCPAPGGADPPASSAETGPDSTAGVEASADTGGFLQAPDGGVVRECDPFEQDCPPDDKCTSYVATAGQQTVDATRCVPIIGEDLPGEPCERSPDNDTCARGSFCMTGVSGGTGPGTCLEYCSPGEPCQFGGACFPFNDGVLPICRQTCDPLAQDCPSGEGCYVAFDNFLCATPGVAQDQGQDGDPCPTVQSCQPGLVCRSDTADCPQTACCTPLCPLDGPATQCPEPEECRPMLEDPAPELMNVGYCGVAP